jgi:hypothetical protein
MSDIINPLLAKLKMPGRIFAIPSRGIMYKNNELLPSVHDGEMQIKPMSALAEIKMRSADLLFSGKAIEEIIFECIGEIRSPRDLFAKDIDAILCFLRVSTYGQMFELNVAHDCEKSKEREVAVDLERCIASMKFMTKEIADMYNIVLSNGQHVKMTPLRYSSLIELLQMQKDPKDMSANDVQTMFIKNFVEIIDEVDGISDKAMIAQWIANISPKLSDEIKDGFDKANNLWGIEMIAEVKCLDCGSTYKIELPVDPVSFFSN